MMRVPDTSSPFDTQQAVDHLQAGGLTSAQAVAITRTLVDATVNLATRADVVAVRADVVAVQAGIDELKASNGRLKDVIDEVRLTVAQSQANTMRMMMLMSFGIIGAVVGLLRWVLPQ